MRLLSPNWMELVIHCTHFKRLVFVLNERLFNSCDVAKILYLRTSRGALTVPNTTMLPGKFHTTQNFFRKRCWTPPKTTNFSLRRNDGSDYLNAFFGNQLTASATMAKNGNLSEKTVTYWKHFEKKQVFTEMTQLNQSFDRQVWAVPTALVESNWTSITDFPKPEESQNRPCLFKFA